jgi:ketosteroid isomerase-like protein
VTAGEEVAYAHALLRCGTEAGLANAPAKRLRLTLGLRREEDRWVVAHEHHSFTDDSFAQREVAKDEIAALHEDLFTATREKDLDRLMTHIADDVVSYEHDAPLQYTDLNGVREVCKQGLESAPGTVTWEVPDLTIIAWEDHAIAWGLNRMTAERGDAEVAESWSRGTRFFEKRDGVWKLTHQHSPTPTTPRPARPTPSFVPDLLVTVGRGVPVAPGAIR